LGAVGGKERRSVYPPDIDSVPEPVGRGNFSTTIGNGVDKALVTPCGEKLLEGVPLLDTFSGSGRKELLWRETAQGAADFLGRGRDFR
jgi:hypothetical protein